jgi:hypothetical protein
MGRPRLAKHPKPEELEPATTPESQQSAEGQAKITKASAVRAALADGLDAPDDIAEFAKSRYGIEISNQMVSSYKSQEKARQAKQADEPKGKPGRKPATASAPTTTTTATAKSASGDIISDIEAVRHLIDKHGKDGLKRLVEALG